MFRGFVTALHASRVVAVVVAALVVLPVNAQAQIRAQAVASGLIGSLAFIQDPDPAQPNTYYIVRKNGLVHTLQNGVLLPTLFADLSGIVVNTQGEQGLLGMAFSPVDHDRVFFSFTVSDGISTHANVVARFRRKVGLPLEVDLTTRLDIQWSTGLRSIPQKYTNHNGGNIVFGPDGYLYISRGDGGFANDPDNHGQNPNSLLAKMLRIDVNVPDADPVGMVIPATNPFVDSMPIAALHEIWAFGLRNPWRFSFDDFGPGATNALIIGDVGQNAREEIDYEPANSGGRNYGWRIREGLINPGIQPPLPAAYLPLTDPVHDYNRGLGQSVTGGYVYRGSVLNPSYQGRYFYADFSSSRVRSIGLSIDPMTGEAIMTDILEHTDELASASGLTSMARDLQGELYFVTYSGPVNVWKIVPDIPGTISTIPDQTISEDGSTAVLPFTIGDADDSLVTWTVSATSSNTGIVPNGNIVLGGSGPDRTISVTPAANQYGTVTITVVFSSRTGVSVNKTFLVTVNSVNDGPTIADVPDVTINEDVSSGALAVNVGDIDTAIQTLVVLASSSNTTLVPASGLALGGSGTARTLTVTPAQNQIGTTTITLSVSDGITHAFDTFVVTVAPVNDGPAIGDVPNVTINEDGSSGALAVSVSDIDSPVEGLVLLASSSNTTLVPISGLVLGGSGSARTVTVTPAANQNGTATITLSVSDAMLVAFDTFVVTVTAVNDAPAIADVAGATVNAGSATGAIAVAVSDVDNPAASLVLTAASSNPTLVPDGGIALGGSDGARTITLTPAATQSGITTITLTVSDGLASTSDTFVLTVNPVSNPPPPLLKSKVIASGLADALAFVPDPDPGNPDTFYVVLRTGLVRTLQNGVLLPTPFADLRGVVATAGEQGLLGMAFSPVDSNRVFLSYTVSDGVNHRNVVSRYRRKSGGPLEIDPASKLDLRWPTTGQRFIPQASTNHNGGHIAFGPDGFLYVARGDGGPCCSAQDPTTLLGKMLRVDVNVPDADANGLVVPPSNPFLDATPIAAAPETWAFGMRNPWQFNFDDFGTGATGALIIGDVGQAAREEIDYEPAGSGGRNYGWHMREGRLGTPGFELMPPAFNPLTEPIHDFDRSQGGAVTGGYVYRGAALNSVYRGRYFYADFISARVWSLGLSLHPSTGEATVIDVAEHTTELGRSLALISAFGRDRQGELYLVTLTGSVVKIVPDSEGTISAIPNQLINRNASTGPLPFTISDADDPSSGWTVTATSSNTTLIPNGNLVLAGSGGSRTIVVTPAANQSGTATITVVFTSHVGASVSTAFTVTVSEPPAPPAPAPAPPPPPPAPAPPTPPSAPRNLTADTPDGRVMVLTWSAPADARESGEVADTATVTGYQIEVGTATGAANAGTFTTGVTTTFTIGALPPAQYFVRVRATSDAGLSAASNEVAVALDGSGVSSRAPRNLRVTVSGRSLGADWDVPLQPADLSGYIVEFGSGPGRSDYGSSITTEPSLTVADLPVGTYFLRVRAIRSAGAGPASSEVIAIVSNNPTPCTTPGVPRALVGTALGTLVQLSWSPPASGGPPASYVVQVGSTPGGTNVAALSFDGSVTSVGGPAPDGTYFLRVIALNSCGISAASNEVTVTIGQPPPPPPGAPGTVTVDVVGRRVMLSWMPPVTGGAPTRYIVDVLAPSGAVMLSFDTGNASTTFTHDSAPSGTYLVRIRAGNTGGFGPPSPVATVLMP